MTKVAVIGSQGWLGSALVAAMKDYQVRRVDIAGLFGTDTFRGDVRLVEDMSRAVEGTDAVVHLAAWHPAHNPPPTSEAMFETNVVGTFRVFQACLQAGVRRVVVASSTGAWRPEQFYGTTKILAEDLCRHYHLAHDFRVAVMQYGRFVPCDLLTHGERLLYKGVDRRDCVDATLAALRAVLEGRCRFGKYPVLAPIPFSEAERGQFAENARAIISRHWPGFEDLLERYSLRLPSEVHPYDPEPARTDLGWEGRYHFGAFLEELRRKDRAGFVRPGCPRWQLDCGTEPPEGIVWPDQ